MFTITQLSEEGSISYYERNVLTFLLICGIIGGLIKKPSMQNITRYKKTLLTSLYHFSGLKLASVPTKTLITSLLIALFSFQMLVPQAYSQANPLETLFAQTVTIEEQPVTDVLFPHSFPVSEDAPLWKIKIPLTAYNSLPGQTDGTPCIAARGYNLCEANEENVIAANFLPMGAKVKIPELFGDREFTVVDRMNARYYYRADIWMREYEDAKKFGIKYATVEVYSYK